MSTSIIPLTFSPEPGKAVHHNPSTTPRTCCIESSLSLTRYS